MRMDGPNQEQESVETEWRREEENKKFLQQYSRYREEIDGMLGRKAYEELLDYFRTEDVRKLCHMETEAAIMNVVLAIYQDEIKNGCEIQILSGIHNIQEARERYLRAKFMMWRLEFFDERDEFQEFLAKNPASPYFLMHLIYTSSFEKGDTALKIAVLLKESRKFGQAFAVLNFLNQLCPDEEIVYCEMADVCIMAGQTESANDCIQRIKSPSGILAGYRRKWGM